MPSIAEQTLRVTQLSKTYGRIRALRSVNFSVFPGEILGVIGPNGAGKTTLFECIAGLEPVDEGEVTFGASVSDARHRSSLLFYMPDAIAPWPDQPVRWVLEYVLGLFEGRRESYPAIVEDFALQPLMSLRLGTLSKGQRKRVLLGLGLLAPQPVLMIDEPFDGLDLRQSREAAAALRRRLTPDRTFVLSIHQIAAAAQVCDRFVLLSGGRVVQEGDQKTLSGLAHERSGHEPRDFEEVFLALT